jgi:hypothetical protein
MSAPKGFTTKVADLFKSMDAYGKPVTLLYKKKPTFNSCVGGVITIFVTICALAYGNYQMSSIILKTSTIFVQSDVRDL